jgi:V8-like Glu-specific endopeptidase
VLTAAHCITEADGDSFEPEEITVCSMENLDENTTGGHEANCFVVDFVIPGPSWVDGTPYYVTYDYGLLTLHDEPGVGWFELSSASDSAITGPTDYVRGYPGFKRDCASNVTSNDNITTADEADGSEMYTADGEVQSTPVGVVRYDTSAARGVSGAPHYYCPNDEDCSQGHYITGVAAQFVMSCSKGGGEQYVNPPCSSGYNEGPKARDIEDWVDLVAISF